jgi:hypothetical protein
MLLKILSKVLELLTEGEKSNSPTSSSPRLAIPEKEVNTLPQHGKRANKPRKYPPMAISQKRQWKITEVGHYEREANGYYQFRDKRTHETYKWQGLIRWKADGIQVYILDPPDALENHNHWRCFSHVGDGWFHIHFGSPMKSLDEVIIHVENIISEALIFHNS